MTVTCIFFFLVIFVLFMALFDSIDEEMTGNGMRERGSDTQQRDPVRESNTGPLQRGQMYSLYMGHLLYPLS